MINTQLDKKQAKEHYGALLIAERERLQLNIQEVSDALGIHRNSLREYELGVKEHGVLLLQGLKGLGYDLVNLLAIDVDNRPAQSIIETKYAAASMPVKKAILAFLDAVAAPQDSL